MIFNKDMLLLYAVTDSTCRQTIYERIELALIGGASMIQLREKDMATADLIDEAVRVKAICKKYNVPLIINDNVEAALESGADGVHVGIDDTPVSEIRRRCGRAFIIGATAKTVEQARAAEADGADYIGVGAVFPSPTKKNAVRITIEQLKAICGSVRIPAAAIGGISLGNIHELAGTGICGIAAVSALFAAADIRSAAEKLREQARLAVYG